MKIKEAIKALEKAQEAYGDINIVNLDAFAVVPIVTGDNKIVRTDIYAVTKGEDHPNFEY